MSYKDKKLKEFEDKFMEKFIHMFWQISPCSCGGPEDCVCFKEMVSFLSSTIDEIMACLPEEYWRDFPETEGEEGYDEGYNAFRDKFLKNLEQKAKEV